MNKIAVIVPAPNPYHHPQGVVFEYEQWFLVIEEEEKVVDHDSEYLKEIGDEQLQ